MADACEPELTYLLGRLQEGGPEVEQLFPLVYQELRRLAAYYMSAERQGHTLQPTALVHEAYVRLAGGARESAAETPASSWHDRNHFFCAAAQTMRRILVDHARGRRAEKRGGLAVRIPLEDLSLFAPGHDENLLLLDRALEKLAACDARQCRIVELRFFCGLSVEETAEVLRLSPATVKREFSMARAWLHRQLSSGPFEQAAANA